LFLIAIAVAIAIAIAIAICVLAIFEVIGNSYSFHFEAFTVIVCTTVNQSNSTTPSHLSNFVEEVASFTNSQRPFVVPHVRIQ